MSSVKGKNTAPEVFFRKALHRLGYRFRIHVKKLPGKPDLVLKKYNAVIFIHGCFWHMHSCRLFSWPKTREAFWKTKLNKNFQNDKKVEQLLSKLGWRICIVWGCAFKGKERDIPAIAERIGEWLSTESKKFEISEETQNHS